MPAERIQIDRLRETAARGLQLEFRPRIEQLPRLQAIVAAGEETALTLVVDISADEEGRPVLGLEMSGEISLVCQRCLGALRWPVAVTASLTVVGSDDEADLLPDPFDSVLVETDGTVSTFAVAEDELLAGVPMAPMHGPGTECCDSVLSAEENAGELMNRPFATLGNLFAAPDKD